MEQILKFLMSTNGPIIIGIIFYLIQHFLGIKKGNKEALEKWLMSQIVGSIAAQEIVKKGLNTDGVPEKEKKNWVNNKVRINVIENIMNIAGAKDKKKALKKIGINLTHQFAGKIVDRVIASSKMGIKLKIRDLPFLKKLF